jgi:hypothetical protein
MDNSSKSIMDTLNITNTNANSNMNAIFGSTQDSIASSSESGGFLGSLFSVPITTWIIIFIILAFLGFNIFVYLAKGTQDITNFFKPIISQVLSVLGIATSEVVDTTATGAKAVVNTTAGAIDAGLTGVQNALPQHGDEPQGNKSTTSAGGASLQNAIPQTDVMQTNSLNQALNKANAQQNIGSNNDYTADDANSSIQKGPSKGGYCYIGEDKGYRSCVYVKEGDSCMSGDIFPSNEICINPSLRA